MSNITCYYHPNRNAIEKCELCGKTICLDCKRVYRETRSSGTSNSSSYYSIKYEYCPVCYHQSIINSARGTKSVLFCMVPFISIFVFIGIGLFLSGFSTGDFGPPPIFLWVFGAFFGGFPLLIIIGLIYTAFVTTPKKVEQSKMDLDRFLAEVGMSDNITYEDPSYYKNSYKKLKGTIYCNQCGSKLEAGDSFCNVCGDSTRDEGL